MQKTLTLATDTREKLYDITSMIRKIVEDSGTEEGLCNVFVHGATAGIMVQENWDDTVQEDVVDLLSRQIPRGVWKHDDHDGNGDSHLKAGIVGPSESIPIAEGKLSLGRWQNIFLCEFDGPRKERKITVSILE